MKNNKKFISLLIIVVVGMIAGGYWYYNQKQTIQTEVAGMEIIKTIELAKLPKTIEQACKEATDMSGEPIDPSDERLCNIFRSPTQSEYLAFTKKLEDAKVGDIIQIPFGVYKPSGTIIDLNGRRAISVLTADRQAVGTRAEIYWLDRDLTLYFIQKDLSREGGNYTVAQTRESKEYKEFLGTISTFKPNR